ncbi:uncharacterized protein LOC124498122 [Dermatophagoides farinae]|uniref:uncharacterized protein LOC124498122 n=1 Tax=Dermatophagoides farinae TaxID=6954 RepID=UPI003F6099A4
MSSKSPSSSLVIIIVLLTMILIPNDLIIVMAMNTTTNMTTTTTTTTMTTTAAIDSNIINDHNDHHHEIIIVDDADIDDNDVSITNRSNTFYSLAAAGPSERSSSVDNNLTIIDDDTIVDDFWDSPSTHPIVSSSSVNSSTTNVTSTRNSGSSSSSSSPSPWSSLSSSTLPPPFTNIQRTSPFTNKPFIMSSGGGVGGNHESNRNDNGDASFSELASKIWKIILHGTNMNSEELRMCNRTLIQQHFKQSSRRKVARNMKKDLEKIFNEWNYRFSIIVSSTSRNTMGKALHGVWMSISINGVHYFITATHKLVDGPKIKEEQMEKIEYWAHVHAIAARNMTGYRRYNRIASKLKFDLDRFYGHGNSWSVIIVKNPLLVKAKILEDPEYHIEFSRLNGGHFIVFRGGQPIENVDGGGRRNGRVDQSIPPDEPESDDHTLEMDTEHEDYRNNIYLMMT